MSNIDIKQLLDGDEQFYPQTDIHALVNDGEYAIDDEPTVGSENLVKSDGISKLITIKLDTSDLKTGLFWKEDGRITFTTDDRYRYCPTYFPVSEGTRVKTTSLCSGTTVGCALYDNNKR